MMNSTDPTDLESEDRTNRMVIMKGAPERILSRCSTMLINGEEIKINDELTKKFIEANKFLGGQGE